MAAPFSTTSAINYNSNPPSDDGSQTPSNRVLWATQKTKLADPIKTAFDTSETNTSTAFGKVPGGAGITSVATDYTVLASDQGKLVRVTASGHVVTTPDATVVGAPFLFCLVNDSTGTITFTGANPGVQQTIDGAASLTILPNVGYWVNTDGTNWFTYGQNFGQLVGSMMSYGSVVNGTIVESNTSNAVTFALKTLAGNDPSSSDPILISFRNVTGTLGNYVFRTVTSATSLVISAGSTLGTSNGVACRVWIVLFDDAGTIRIGAINCLSGNNIYPLGRNPIASSTAEGGAGAADSAQVFYTGTSVTNKPYLIFANATYESGLSTAGNWNVDPSLSLFGLGSTLPGQEIQEQSNFTGDVATGTTVMPWDDTIPQNTEGDQYMSQAITPVSAANLLTIDHSGTYAASIPCFISAALFHNSTANALSANEMSVDSTNFPSIMAIKYFMVALTTSSTTFKVRAGPNTAATVTFNGVGGGRHFGGVHGSYIRVAEIMC